MSKRRTWQVENTWTCLHCKKTNRGRDLRCVQCGAPKDKNIQYNHAGSEKLPVVTDPKLLAIATGGKNWECEYCHSSVRNKDGECAYCGGDRPEVPQKVATPTPKYEAPKYEDKDTYTPRTILPPPKNQYSPTHILGCALLGISFIVASLVWHYCSYHTEHVTVSDTYWKHTTTVQLRHLRHGTGWESDAPAGYFNATCETRQNGTHNCNPYSCNPHQVPYSCNCQTVSTPSCHTSCIPNGNGFSTCTEVCTTSTSTSCSTCYNTEYDTCYQQCPTYEDWCEYDYYNWERERDLVTQGHDQAPRDADVSGLTFSLPHRFLYDREYLVRFAVGSENRVYRPTSRNDYVRFRQGDHWQIEANLAGSVKVVKRENVTR